MSFQINSKDFRFYLYQLKLLSEAVGTTPDPDFSALLTKAYYDSIYENGEASVCVPLVSSAYACDNIDFSYKLTSFTAYLTAIDAAFETYFLQHYGDPNVVSTGDYMLKENISVTREVDAFYYQILGKHFYAGTVYVPENTVHYTYTYNSTTETWTGAYTTQIYDGSYYDQKSISGLMTKPQRMMISVAGSEHIAARFTFETQDGNGYQLLTLFSTPIFTRNTEVEVLRLSSIEILNSSYEPYKDSVINNGTTITVTFLDGYENHDNFTSTEASTLSATNGHVLKGKPDTYFLEDLDFEFPILAVPDTGYYFTGWSSGGSNPKCISYSETPDVPSFEKYTEIVTHVFIDGVESQDFYIEFPGMPTAFPYCIPGTTIYPTLVYDKLLYSFRPLNPYELNDGLETEFFSYENGDSVFIKEACQTFIITYWLQSLAQVSFLSVPSPAPEGYQINFGPLEYREAGNNIGPAFVLGATIEIAAWLTETLPTEIYVFNKWSDSLAGDYKALKNRTLAATNEFTAEFTNLGESPEEHTILFKKPEGIVPGKLYDLTNLNTEGANTELTPTIGTDPDVPYAVYAGANICFRFSMAIGGTYTVAVILDGNTLHTETNPSTAWYYDVVLENISADHTIEMTFTV